MTIMGDRDIPSVPVTTLAGLTSISDLLSELPVSESFSSVATLNKSLLFHTLVAEESNNLLSVRDDNLVRQLVHAIEQTSAENIELKSQYSINQQQINISEYPELLKGIYTFRPTVFNTPKKHHQQQHGVTPIGNIQQPQQNVVPINSGVQLKGAPQITNLRIQSNITSTNAAAASVSPVSINSSTPTVIEVKNTLQQNLSGAKIVQQNKQVDPIIPVATSDVFLQNKPIKPKEVKQQNFIQNSPQQIPLTNINHETIQQKQPQLIQTNNDVENVNSAAVNVIKQNIIQNQTIIRPPQNVVKPENNPSTRPDVLNQNDSVISQNDQPHIKHASTLSTNIQPKATDVLVQEEPKNVGALVSKPKQIQDKQNDHHTVITENKIEVAPELNEKSENEKVGNVSVISIQKQEQTQNELHLVQVPVTDKPATPVPILQPQDQIENQINLATMEKQNKTIQTPNITLQKETNKTPPDIPKSEIVPVEVQQSSHVSVNNISNNSILASQTTVHPSVTQIKNEPVVAEVKPALKKFTKEQLFLLKRLKKDGKPNFKCKVRIGKISRKHTKSLLKNIKEFINKYPESAKKLKLVKVESDDLKPQDIFSRMKADERRNAVKRKLPAPPELTPEQIISKPKLRKVERSIVTNTVKTSKEELQKSQTYQQFLRNIDNIIELLDDTEQPNFNSEETDETIEPIPSKMLNLLSNDVAKLKAKGVLDLIPKNKLTLLINYAMRSIYLARNYSSAPDVDEDMFDEEIMEKILNAVEATLLVCNIYSTVGDLKFLQEDNIASIIKFIQFQFRETIFPSYDPVYVVKNLKKSSGDNRKKTKAQHMHHNRSLQLFYSKIVELMKVLVTLFDKCNFVDTIILPLSTLAIEPFFVDNIETLQFVCLELVTTLFRKEQYVNMRSSILADILASIDRLPSSKKNLRPFKLANNGGSIQMITALILQLIQCATILPDSLNEKGSKSKHSKSSTVVTTNPINNDENENNSAGTNKSTDIVVLEKYDTAMSIGGNFLTTFLSKCKSRTNETDFRPLFENFIHDLLSTVNRPEWPAAELLLSLLGTLLVKYMSDKNIEQSIRLASLDYLGIVAARLRKDTVESRCKVNIMDQMVKSIKAEQEKEGDLDSKDNSNIILNPDEERIIFLQNILLDFLAVNAQEENLIWDYAKYFYLAQWYRDVIQQKKRVADGGSNALGGDKNYAYRKKNKNLNKRKRKPKTGSEEEESVEEISDEDDDDDENIQNKNNSKRNSGTDAKLNLEIFQALEERKQFLLRKSKPFHGSSSNTTSQYIKTYIDYNNAHLIAQYLASRRPFSQSFDKYLQKIILVVREPAIAIRTRAMKCLANIVEVDPLILKRKDMQMGVNQKFLDTAISVREAAVDLIGKYVLSSEDLIDQYYEMLSKRILDTGVSVRKRVIKILRDICIEYPDFEKIPEICVKMIRRVNDEEGIQKLVTEVFMSMWFTPCPANNKLAVYRKINQIIDVVNTAHDTGTLWLDGLLQSIFTPKDHVLKAESSADLINKKNTEPPAEVVLACQQLADGLVERLIELEDTDNDRMLGCITTIHLLAKARPQLLVKHAITIEPYLNIKCHSTVAPKFICSVAEILEQVVPLMEHPSDSFLADLEAHLMMLVVSLNQKVVASCVSCLGSVVNKITKNYKLIRDCFTKFYKTIASSRDQLKRNPALSMDSIYQPMFRRSLYTIGILMRFFDFKTAKVLGTEEGDKIPLSICDEVFDSLMFFITGSNIEIRKQALVSLGFFCIQNEDYLTRPELRDFYCDLLISPSVEPYIKSCCMRNIWMYLTESEINMFNKEKDWAKQAQLEDLKEMNDVSSGMASRIIQLYLNGILKCFLHPDYNVRLWAVKVVQIVLRQGLVHPVIIVPYLIALSTDEKQETSHRSDHLLKELDKTYTGFVNMKVQQGLELTFQLQEVLQCKNTEDLIRGYVKRDNQVVSLNDFLYTLLRNTKPQRRALVQTVIKQFDDQKTTLRQMLYLADNLAYFPYVVQDEPLYLIHQIDIVVSNTGTTLLTNFREGLKPKSAMDGTENDKENGENKIKTLLEDDDEDDDEEDKELLFERLPSDTKELQQCIVSAQGCMLLLLLKQHLKDMYGLTDGKISRYSPSEPKVYEKAINRKPVNDFQPKSTIDVIKKGKDIYKELDDKEKRDLIDKYLDFKQLMLRLDPDDADSENADGADPNQSSPNKTKINADPNDNQLKSAESNETNHIQADRDKQQLQQDKKSTPHHFEQEYLKSIGSGGQQQQENPLSTTPTIQRHSGRNSSKSTTNTPQHKKVRSTRNKRRKIVSSGDDDSDYSDN